MSGRELETLDGGSHDRATPKHRCRQKLQQLSTETNGTHDDSYKLNPVDVNDIWNPDKCENKVSKLATWHESFRGLLENLPSKMGACVDRH